MELQLPDLQNEGISLQLAGQEYTQILADSKKILAEY